MENERFILQIFKRDETGLFWKKIPNRIYITQEEKPLPGHKPMKDTLTLLVSGNTSEDYKMKTLLIYHSENSKALKTLSRSNSGL